jgi:ATP-dependent Clp protease ATP-binding subunit ClpC
MLELEDLFPHHIRKIVLDLSAGLALVLLGMLTLGHSADPHVRGGFLVALAIALFIATLEVYFYSYFARAARGDYRVSFQIARMIFYADDGDLVRGFLFSDIGDETLKRLGFEEKEIKDFLSKRQLISFESYLAGFNDDLSVERYGEILYKNDKAFADLLFTKGLSQKEFVAALRWTVGKDFRKTERERFWSHERLGRIPGLGKNWAYGETYVLERYSEDLTEESAPYEESYEKVHEKAVQRLETVLVRGHDANAIIVSDDEESRLDIVTMLAQWIEHGKALPSIGHKRVFLLNPNLLVESASDKLSFERELTSLLIESQRAGNVILVIPNFSAFLASALALGSDVLSVFSPYITSPVLHIVALDSKAEYHAKLATREIIATHFEMIDIGEGSNEGLITMLESEAEKIERHSHFFITYPALLAIADSAGRYFDLASVTEKAKDLLLDAPIEASRAGRHVVTKEDVLKGVEEKTGIPTGAPEGEERQKLLEITDLLHGRVVGQDEAVTVVSDALKRSRSGVKNPDKPMGTFLFLGPTGVGKTETAKALADVFFGSEKEMSRIDMSEYHDNFAIERLIGSFASGKAGRLPALLHEKPYGVLLLDEFEKTTQDVINVFLRLFDEGVITDAEGRKANAKNTIIIATSNAGSELVWEIVKNGGDLKGKKQEVIDAIIKEGVFKPELLNRFDAVVLFHPLQKEDLTKIASLMMDRFIKRMRERGIDVTAAPRAIEYLVSKGTDPKFGARPMQRAISEEVERIVAEKIIGGELHEGSQAVFDTDASGVLKISIT